MFAFKEVERYSTLGCCYSFLLWNGIRKMSQQARACSEKVTNKPSPRNKVNAGKKGLRPTMNKTNSNESIVTGPMEFKINASEKNPAFALQSNDNRQTSKKILENVTFLNIGLRSDVIQGLEDMQISQPTVIQMKAIPEILKGNNVLCAAQTGSGKTLAYLVPILNHLKAEEDKGKMTRFQRPRVCIVAPFRELAAQILKVVKQMSYQVPVRSLGCIGGEKDRLIYRGLRERPIDIVVATPGTIVDLLKKRKLLFTDLSYLVIDEVDTMFDASFKSMTNYLFNVLAQTEAKSTEASTESRYVFAAATLPKIGVMNIIKAQVQSVELVTARLHHVLPHVNYIFMKMLQPEKPAKLIDLLRFRISQDKKVVIFVNSTSTCNWLSNYLEQHSFSNFKLSGKDKPENRQKIFKELREKNDGILISTDIASRGLDFPDLFCVINYDCPLNPSDFIHRAGRTGRARAEYFGTPEVYTLLSRNWELSLARNIQFAALKKKEIEDVKVIKRQSGPADVIKEGKR